MVNTEIFPQKIALGTNFCNRVKEQAFLKDKITGTRPSLIISPRRYGKTSLGIYVLERLRIPYVHLDLFPLTSTEDIETTLLSGIGDILARCEPTPKKALKVISEFFGQLSVSFSIIKAKVEVTLTRRIGTAKTLQTALKSLDEVLHKKKMKAVIFLDEFQRLSQIESSEEIEGAIRHVAQQSKNLVFIFSGSNRHLLGKMFDESHRPLYKLCDRLVLERISESDYTDFFQKQALQTWKKQLHQDIIDAIFECTECHPYYINALCYRLWKENHITKATVVFDTWKNYALGEKSTVFRELEGLSSNQFKLLVSLARYGNTKSVFGDDFIHSSGMALSSTKQALKVLQEKDYIYQHDNMYRILDPLIKYILAERL